MNPLKFGLFGFGYAGQTFHAPLVRATAGLELAAVASSDAARVHAALGSAVAVLTPSELLARSDIDCIVVASPNDSHHPLALAALEAGRHVVVDKPFAIDAAQAAAMVTAAERHGRLLSVFHNRRWDSDFLGLRRFISDGSLGRPVELITHFDRYRPEVRARWREGDGPGAGIWMDLGPHLVDQALQLFGLPQAITLDRARLREGALADDWFSAHLRWTRGPHAGLRAQLSASMLAAHAGPRFVLHGSGGSLRIDGLDPQEAALKAGATPATLQPWGADSRQAQVWRGESAAFEPLALPSGDYPHYYAALRDALLGLGPNPVPAREALAVQQVIDAGLRSDVLRAEQALAFD
ncbi:Uncharacterized oxidoreductase YdgJ [Rubrivivax sp. A210]|uniref:oxidoreductase n=1 Tax=Rubrivivax sp. A210 TaxID=2772301 RepID=UPI00191800CF|nr:oxidoreductase [Rubrivivax sp. A210]CAD5372698.1 Uncharacterized oxidoreductase YdgJ [Rubrivivax sp. A210]